MFSDKIEQNVVSDYFSRPRSQGLTFGVRHYAGKVSLRDGSLILNCIYAVQENTFKRRNVMR